MSMYEDPTPSLEMIELLDRLIHLMGRCSRQANDDARILMTTYAAGRGIPEKVALLRSLELGLRDEAALAREEIARLQAKATRFDELADRASGRSSRLLEDHVDEHGEPWLDVPGHGWCLLVEGEKVRWTT